MRNLLICFCIFFLIKSPCSWAQQNEAIFLQSLQKRQSALKTDINKGISFSVYPISFVAPVSIAAYGLYKKDSVQLRKSACVAGSLLLAASVSTALKFSILRKRPYVSYPNYVQQLDHSGPYSFPSGHTTIAFSTATTLSLQYKKWYVIVPAFAWAGSVAYSRMYLGVHYPSDVAGGIVCGVGSALLTQYLNKKIFVK